MTLPDRERIRRELVDEIARQQTRFVPSERRERHLDQLRARASVVVTGQQAGLFLGPAYTVYKAATAIVEARRRGAVPVFWVQDEDHDAAEVSSCNVLGADGELRTVTLVPTGRDRVSLAHRGVGDVERAIAELADALDGAPARDETIAWLARHWRPGARWVDGFAGAIAELFGREGLVVFDPRTPAVAELAKPVHRFAIERAEAIERALVSSSGVDPQVPIRAGCLLSFVHADGPEGPRFRPTREDGGWTWPGAKEPVSGERLLAMLDASPLSFSTSTLLRPLLQDHLFATAAYVAGPSEARYLAQVPPLHALFGASVADVIPRARFVVTDARTRAKLESLGLAATDAALPEAELRARVTPAAAVEARRVREQLLAPFLARIDALGPDLAAIDSSLDRAVDRTRRRVEEGVGRLAARVEAAVQRRDAVAEERLRYVRSRLAPGGAPQERVLSFVHLASRFGTARVEDAVLAGDHRSGALQELAL